MRHGEHWDESTAFPDIVTARASRRLTCHGHYNQTPTYHLNAAFTADSRYLVFATAREGVSALMKAEVATGEITVVAVTDGIGLEPHPHCHVSPDGQWLSYNRAENGRSDVYVVSLA